jgi:hypothetical protein
VSCILFLILIKNVLEGRMDKTLEPRKPTAPVTAASPMATRWVIDALAPLREYLTPWPAVLPSDVDDPIWPPGCQTVRRTRC